MSEGILIRGRAVVKGRAEGRALVADATLSFWGEVDAPTGKIIAVGHPLEGESLKERVLIIRSTKGSSGTPMILRLAALEGTAPLALVNIEVDALAALACIVNEIPLLTDLDENPFQHVRSGDWVEVDADQGVLRVKPAGEADGGGRAGPSGTADRES